MPTAEDFVPTEAEINIESAYFMDGVENLAGNKDSKEKIKEINDKIKAAVRDYEDRFDSQRGGWAENSTGLWPQMDAAHRSFVNDSSVQSQTQFGADDDDAPRAKIGTPNFHRQVTQMAANGYAAQTSKPVPFKYSAISDGDSDEDVDHAKQRAKKLNLLAKWSMKKDNFKLISMDFWTQIKKYGNVPVMVEWKYRKGKRKIRVPVYNKTDPRVIDEYRIEEIDAILENRPHFSLLPIASVKGDVTIGNVQDQECLIVLSVVGMSKIISGIKAGFYRKDMLKDLKRIHQWDGISGFVGLDEKKENRGLSDEPLSDCSGQYLKREVFINVPIDNGKWHDSENIPVRYRVTMFGNDHANSVIACIERNREPDDTIPIEMIHANPDDSDFLYHISDYEVVRPNLSVETSIIRQIVDNGSLVNKNVMWEVEGGVIRGINGANDREFVAGQRFIVESKDSMGVVQVRDISQSAMAVLNHITESSNTALRLDKGMMGEGQGARTSSLEAGNIAANSQRPNIVNIEYILEQLLPFVAQRYKIGWEHYGLKNQMIQITDEDDNPVFIRPTEIYGEFDIEIDILDDIKDDAVKSARRLNYIQTVAGIPQLAATIDWVGISNELAEDMMGTSKFVVGNNEGDTEDNARRNLEIMLTTGQPPQMAEGMNLRKHLEIYKSNRLRWVGHEDQNQYVESVLDQVIAQIEERLANPPKQGQAPAQPEVGGNEANRQLTSGALGGI